MLDLVIKNGRVVTESGVTYGGIAIEGEQIAHVGSDVSLPRGRRIIDAGGSFVIPGLIDPHVHFSHVHIREGTVEDRLRALFRTETEGALHGGVTTFGHFVADVMGKPLMPIFETTRMAGQESSYVDFFFHAVINDDDNLAEEEELFRRGVTSFKHFFNPPSWREPGAKVGHCNEGILFQSFDNVAKLGYPAIGMTHCEEMSIINVLTERLRAAGRNDLKAWAEARPPLVECMRMQQVFEIAKAVGARVYIVHISSADGAELMAKWRRQGHQVWGETLVAYLTHTADMEEQIGCWGRNNPAIKFARDRERLWQGIKEGSISVVGTDHVPMSLEGKEGDGGKHNNIWGAASALCGGMEHMLPVMMTFGVNAGRISIEDLVRVCSTNAAKIFGLYPRKGVLSPGSDADIVIVDPGKEAMVDDDFYHCRGEFSIYRGWKLKGLARTAIVSGQVMMEDYATVGKPGQGKYLPCRAY